MAAAAMGYNLVLLGASTVISVIALGAALPRDLRSDILSPCESAEFNKYLQIFINVESHSPPRTKLGSLFESVEMTDVEKCCG